jgi:hypothetical protein
VKSPDFSGQFVENVFRTFHLAFCIAGGCLRPLNMAASLVNHCGFPIIVRKRVLVDWSACRLST